MIVQWSDVKTKFRTSLERLSSIPGRCIIPEGIYASDFSPNCFEIPHSSWPRHTRDDIKLVIVVVSISASGRGDDKGVQLCPEFPDICSFCRCWRECVDVLRDVDTLLLTGVLECWHRVDSLQSAVTHPPVSRVSTVFGKLNTCLQETCRYFVVIE